MTTTSRPRPRSRSGSRSPYRVGAGLAPVLVLALVLGGAAGACTGDHAAPTAPAGPAITPHATPTHGAPASGVDNVAAGIPVDATMPAAEAIAAAWAARPAFVTDAPARTQAAYAYAIARPDVLRWLPCYCGCGPIGHRSNLDCFFVARFSAGDPIVFEQHGSYCDICVETALLADAMLRDGKTLLQVRAAVDASFGGLAPGTLTELPPAG
jgi:hypothetical protein